jgi:6-phosphofructokinase 2
MVLRKRAIRKQTARMKPIVTLTLNPAIDGASEAEVVRPTHKVRTSNARYDPGGGGINVARVIAELGRPALPVYLGGGATGGVLDGLLVERGFRPLRIAIRDHTRISQAVFERSSGLEFRFVPEGPSVASDEWQRVFGILEGLDFDWLVASGSLPRGVPDDFYVGIVRIAAAKGARVVLDTSGAALQATVAAGGVYLVKPSIGEFESLVGRSLPNAADQNEAATALVRQGGVNLLAVTLGHAGALLASSAGVTRLHPPDVVAKSAVGAGDSFLGAMTFALAEGRATEDAFMLGIAAGSAAVLTPGTELCRKEDVLRLYSELVARNARRL